jgi:NDP-sugar pyrophosphorylase family protein
MAYFSEQGARLLQEVYEDCLATQPSPFHEAPSIERAGVTDIIQELIDRGVPVYGQEVYKGWIEVHSREDVATAEREVTAAAAI